MAEEGKKEETQETEEQATTGKKGNKTIIMMGGVVLISVICAFVFVTKVYPSLTETEEQINAIEAEAESKQTSEVTEIQEEKPLKAESGDSEDGVKEPLIVQTDTIIVNLSGSNLRRYLKTKIVLEMLNKEAKSKAESRSIQIKDRLISILSSKTLEDIDSIEGREALRNEIRDSVDVILGMEKAVKQVYFEEFVVQ